MIAIAEAEGVADAVTFVGSRGRDSLRYYYSAADVFFTTPWYEPFGITRLEAAACGTPVIGAAVGGVGGDPGRMTPGEAVSAATLTGLLFAPVARLADLASILQQAAASTVRLGEILDMQPDVIEPSAPVPFGRARGLVEFDRVGFGFKARQPVLWDVRLRIEPGTKVALVGPTGCGKNTLASLLLRFYDPTWGEIRLDGARYGGSRRSTSGARRASCCRSPSCSRRLWPTTSATGRPMPTPGASRTRPAPR